MSIFSLSGCSQPVSGGEPAQTTPASIKPELPLLDKQIHGHVETAYFALGWFWGSDSQFGSIEGVIRTRAGYCGGTTTSPNYHNIGNHSETVQIDFDTTVVSYEQLLTAFWSGHNATLPTYTAQYRSAIFYTTEQQQKLASEAVRAEEARLGKKIYTDVEPFIEFFVAEDYHQKYYLRQASWLVNDLYSIYPDPAEFRDSTAAARLNGYLGGYGDQDSLKQNLDSLGLSESGKTALLQRTLPFLARLCPVITP